MMWRKIVASIYGISPYGWKSADLKKRKGNRIWANIAKFHPVFDQFIQFVAKDGKNIRFWEDRWGVTINL